MANAKAGKAFRIPTINLPARSSSPRTRSKSLNLARSPLLPTTPHDPANADAHRRGGSLYHLPDLSSEDEIPETHNSLKALQRDSSDDELDLEIATLGSVSLPDSYDGPFQSLDRHELIVVIISFAGVGLLAIAAGLTTIYDWIL